MKKLLTIAALTALTATSAFATTSYQGWRGHDGWRGQEGWRAQAMQSYASDELVYSPRYQIVTPRDSSTSTYFGHFGPSQTTGSSVVQ
jgi:hypothetical protein